MPWPRIGFLKSPLAKELGHLAWIFLGFRALLLGFAFLATAATQERHPNPNKLWEAFEPGHFFLNGFFHWDAGWYRLIAERGYFQVPGLAQSNVAFFPLFPYLSRWLGAILGSHLIAGIVIANLGFFLGLFFLARIARLYFDDDAAERAVLLVLLFPASWFLSAYYSEGLFLGVTTASFYFFLRGRYLPAALFGALACATRTTGMTLLAAYAIGLGADLYRRRLRFRWSALWLLLIPVGLLAFMWLLDRQVGDPLAFANAQAGWGRSATYPWVTLYREFARVDYAFPRDLMNTDRFLSGLAAVAFLALPLLLLRRVHVSLVVYAELCILLPLGSGSVLAMIRFTAVAFPSFLALSHLARTRPRERLIFCGMTLFLGFFTLQFFNWYWAG